MKPVSERFDAYLMAYKGGKKPKKAKVVPTISSMGQVNNAGFNSNFGSAQSSLQPYEYVDPITGVKSTKDTIQTSMALSDPLSETNDLATDMVNNQLGFLSQDPNERLQFLMNGQDPTYNLLKEQNDRFTNTALGRARLNAFKGGGSNSTMLGGAIGSLLNDDIMRNNQLLTNVVDFRNNNARQDANLGMGVIGNLANLLYPMGSAANGNLMMALQDQSRAQAATAAAQNMANLNYANALNQYNAQRSSSLGSGIGSLLGAGMSLFGGPLGGIFGGSGGGAATPSYVPPFNPYSNLSNNSYWDLSMAVG